ncbi:MAG TPA: hypothetical protein PLX66_03030 [Bacilli bacterium]|nr:hypothetical protein [Bacilli bacterium]
MIVLSEKQKSWYIRRQLLTYWGLAFNLIQPFEEEVYRKLDKVIFGNIPASIKIKYLKPITPPGQCYERSWIITMAFDECLLVRGNSTDYAVFNGEKEAGHGWVEHNGWVYDPSDLLKYKTWLYYLILKPYDIIKTPKAEIQTEEDYQHCIKGRIDKSGLAIIFPLIERIAKLKNNGELIEELALYLKNLGYNSIQELQEEVEQIFLDLETGEKVDDSRIYIYYSKK